MCRIVLIVLRLVVCCGVGSVYWDRCGQLSHHPCPAQWSGAVGIFIGKLFSSEQHTQTCHSHHSPGQVIIKTSMALSLTIPLVKNEVGS